MKIIVFLICMFFCIPNLHAQQDVIFPKNKKKITIPFKLINNLVIIPLKVNGTDLNFLLDTGVEETILFSLEDERQMDLFKVEKLMLRGLGGEESTEGLRSFRNHIVIGKLELKNQEILIVLDREINFSSSLGMPVNGIIGYHFFKDLFVKIDYAQKKIHVFNKEKVQKSELIKDFTAFDISIERSKPYLKTLVNIDSEINAKLLLDTGNSDALWLFSNQSEKVKIPAKNLDDFLGRGFSGPVHGKRARINNVSFGDFSFNNPIVAFPDTTSLRNVKMVDERLGSIGGEIFKRFTVIFDYGQSKMYVKKNENFRLPFSYNKSGIEIHHSGMRLVKEAINNTRREFVGVKVDLGKNGYELEYKFELKPSYEISSVRKDSPAEIAGLKRGDILISINKLQSYSHSLQEINGILKSNEGRLIEVEIERDNKPMRFSFRLQNLL